MNKQIVKFKESEKGVTLYMSLLILSAVLAMSSAIVILMINEFKIAGDIQKSMMAVYAADTGLEVALYKARHGGELGVNDADCFTYFSLILPSNSSCRVDISDTAQDPVIINSTGTHLGINRKIQSVYQNK